MLPFIAGFIVGGFSIMMWAIVSQTAARSQTRCDLCDEYHHNTHMEPVYEHDS